MLLEKCLKYYDKKYDLNCAEAVLYGANEEYSLGLELKDFKLAAGFGGGMGIEDVCGAATGAIMVLGIMFTVNRAHEADKVKTLTKEFLERFKERLTTLNCKELKALYRTEEKRCSYIIEVSAEILDDIVKKEL
jgi:C_GCAxxG_C_C family probable redox protein